MDLSRLREIVRDSLDLKRSFFEEKGDAILEAGRLMSEALRSGQKILAFGNGGSAADAQHFAGEIVNRFGFERPALAALALTTDTSVLTSVANDSHYRYVFSRQVEALGAHGDVALAISTSGNSENVLEGVKACRKAGVKTIGLTGRDGGRLAAQVDLSLNVPHPDTPRIQEVHGMVVHLICQAIEEALYPRGS